MTTRFDCALNGVLLSSLNERICVLDLKEAAPGMRTTTLTLQPEGHRLLRRWRDSLTVQAVFAIQDENPVNRRATLRAVHAWAEAGGLLTITDRPGQRLRVRCASLPDFAAEDWQQPLTLTFVAAGAPYWEDAAATSVTGSDVLDLLTPGTAENAPVDAFIINDTDATVTRLKIYCGGTQMIFEGIDMPVGAFFLLTQSDGPLTASVNGESVLANRTPESDDLLLAPCGRSATVYASDTQPLQASFTVRGRYV